MKFLLTTLLYLISYVSSGQQFITISGKVTDSTDAKPLPYVGIMVKHKSIGAVTNEVGEFVFNLPKSTGKDTLVFTFIGYLIKEVAVSSLTPNKVLTVALIPKESFLQTVSVTSKRLTAESVIKEAVAKIAQNYPQSPHLLQGFFRDWKTVDFTQGVDGDNGVLIEAAINILDSGYLNKNKKNQEQAFIKEIRRTELLKDAGWNYQNSLNALIHKNLVKYTGAKDFSDPSPVLLALGKFKYIFSETASDNDYFVIEATAPNYDFTYTIYITTTDYAIARIDLKTQQEFVRGDTRIKSVNNTQRFRQWNGKWYLSYLRRNWQLDKLDSRSGKVLTQEDYNMEFLVNDILPAGQYKKEDLGYAVDSRKPLEFQVKAYNEAFWKNYNILKDNPLNPSIKALLEKKKSLADQYKNTSNSPSTAEARPLPEQWHDSRWVFNRADTLQGSLNAFRSCYDVHFYDLTVNLNPTKKEIAGTSVIHFTTKAPTAKIQVDLNSALTVESIEWENQKLAFTREYNAVFIQFPKNLAIGSSQKISIKYKGNPLEPDFRVPNYGAFIWNTDSQGKAWVQSVCQGSGANGWWPIKDHISDKADSVSFTVTVPSDLLVISNGQLILKADSGNTATYKWRVNYPILNYNIAVHAGDYTHWQESFAGTNKFNLNFYALKSSEKEAKAAFKVVVPMLRQYEKFFGPYPFPKDHFKILQTPYPMEHQTAVAVGPDFKEELILHETAHEWWGNSVSCTDLADIWLHEAFATYAVYMYLEAERGKESATEYLNYLEKNIKHQFPLVGTAGVNDIHYDFTDAYSKGALLLHTLRNLIGNDAMWFDLLKGLQTNYKYKSITTPELIRYINQKTKKDFTYLFDQFLYRTEVPVLETRMKTVKNKLQVQYRWQNTQPQFSLPIKVTEAPGKFAWVYPTATWQVMEIANLNYQTFQVEPNPLIKVSKLKAD